MCNYFRKVSDERKAIIWVISRDGQKTKEDYVSTSVSIFL